MFILENNILTDSSIGKSFPSFSILFDLKSKRIICHGSTSVINRKCNDISSNPLSTLLPKAISFDSPTQNDVDNINMMLTIDNYPETWLRNNGYIG